MQKRLIILSLIFISTNVFCWEKPFKDKIQKLIEIHKERKNEKRYYRCLIDLIEPISSWLDVGKRYSEKDPVVLRVIIKHLDFQRLRVEDGKVVGIKLSFKDLKDKTLEYLRDRETRCFDDINESELGLHRENRK